MGTTPCLTIMCAWTSTKKSSAWHGSRAYHLINALVAWSVGSLAAVQSWYSAGPGHDAVRAKVPVVPGRAPVGVQHRHHHERHLAPQRRRVRSRTRRRSLEIQPGRGWRGSRRDADGQAARRAAGPTPSRAARPDRPRRRSLKRRTRVPATCARASGDARAGGFVPPARPARTAARRTRTGTSTQTRQTRLSSLSVLV